MSRYGCDPIHYPCLMTLNGGSSPLWSYYHRIFELYYLVPTGRDARDDYNPQIFVFNDCTVKSLRSIIISSLPPFQTSYSVEFFSYNPPVRPTGWSVTSLDLTSPILLEKDAAQSVPSFPGESIIVSVKVMGQVGRPMVPIDPFPSPTSPPKVLAWTPSCA